MKFRSTSIVSSIFASACATVAVAQEAAAPMVKARYHDWLGLPDALTASAVKVDNFINFTHILVGGVFLGVCIAMGYFMIKYRQRAGGKAIYSHGNNKLEVVWTIIPAIILIVIAVASASLWSEMKMEKPKEENSLVIEIRPRQFQWDIAYSGADGKFGTPDDILTVSQLHVPANKDVVIRLMAQDVIHSFFVPEFRMKQDAVPGMVQMYWFKCIRPAKLEIACAELCGSGHGRMRGYLTVMEPAEYDKWYAEQLAEKAKELAPPPPDTTAKAPAVAPTDTTKKDTTGK